MYTIMQGFLLNTILLTEEVQKGIFISLKVIGVKFCSSP